MAETASHKFDRAPNKTVVGLAFPVLLSLIAEPLTGSVDTGFVASLGAPPLAALGVGTVVLSSAFWIFNFLGVGTQTQVAQAQGSGQSERGAALVGMAMTMAVGFGLALIAIGWWLARHAATAMGATGEVAALTEVYIQYRLLGAPAVLLAHVAFGALRGLQDMRTPMWVAFVINGLNLALDPLFIFGWGFVPAMGVKGAALASALSYWVGAAWALLAVYRRFGRPAGLQAQDARLLVRIGGDLFIRTGLLSFFLLLTTRAATQMGADGGAAHQAVRQVWMFTALFLDAFAITGQSLAGYYLGAKRIDGARAVARVVCLWSLGAGLALLAAMLAGEGIVARLLVPETALPFFSGAWLMAALFQPINALTFATDGLHWGSGDFRYLRNAMIVVTALGAGLLFFVDISRPDALLWIWAATGVWIVVRAGFGIARIWPGVGDSPYNSKTPPR